MRGRLFLINLLLLACIAGAAMELKKRLDETSKREALVRASGPVLPSAKPVAAVANVEKTTPANYLDIAARLLFSKDRNPTVEPPPPPAPPQMPAFPLAYGVLMIGDPPTVMLSEAKGKPQRGYRPGDRVGEFKILAVTGADVTFEWQNKKITKTLGELADREASKLLAAAPPPPASDNASSAPSNAPATKAVTDLGGGSSASKQGPGQVMTPTMKQCQPGDTAPDGAVVDGFRKINTPTPFGFQCRWEKIQ